MVQDHPEGSSRLESNRPTNIPAAPLLSGEYFMSDLVSALDLLANISAATKRTAVGIIVLLLSSRAPSLGRK